MVNSGSNKIIRCIFGKGSVLLIFISRKKKKRKKNPDQKRNKFDKSALPYFSPNNWNVDFHSTFTCAIYFGRSVSVQQPTTTRTSTLFTHSVRTAPNLCSGVLGSPMHHSHCPRRIRHRIQVAVHRFESHGFFELRPDPRDWIERNEKFYDSIDLIEKKKKKSLFEKWAVIWKIETRASKAAENGVIIMVLRLSREAH